MTVTGEFSQDNYLGLGLGLGILYYPIQDSNFKPFIGISYTRMMGGSFGYDRGANVVTTFNVSNTNYLIPFVGIRYNDSFNGQGRKNYLSYFLKIGYKASSGIYPKATYASGPVYQEKLDKINSHINDGIIASVGLILNIVKK